MVRIRGMRKNVRRTKACRIVSLKSVELPFRRVFKKYPDAKKLSEKLLLIRSLSGSFSMSARTAVFTQPVQTRIHFISFTAF